MNPAATTQQPCHALRGVTSASTWDFAPWMTLAASETTALIEGKTESQCYVVYDTDEECHFAFLASSAFDTDALDAAEGGCPTPRLCAANGCRGLCPPPSAA